MIHLLWGKDLRATPRATALRVMAMNAPHAIVDRMLLWQSLAVLVVVDASPSCSRGRCISSPRPSRSPARRC